MRVAFHTLGCKVNQYETEAIKEAFVSRGAAAVGEDDVADIYVINTCTVTNIADRKSRQFIRRARKANPDAVVVVTGCYAQTSPEEVESMPEVDLLIGNSLKTEIADKAIAVFMQREPGGAAVSSESDCRNAAADAQTTGDAADGNSFPGSHVLSYDELTEYEDMGIVTFDESSMCRAYIKIEEGCNRFCSYCLIPYARGRVRSRDPEDIEEEARRLIGSGCREIVLTGINTALYGTEEGFSFERRKDEEGLSGLEMIIKRLDGLEGDFRIRLSSLEPTVVDKDHVERIIKYKKLCHHLHLSVQSGSSRILDAMNRHYTREEYLDIVKAIRRYDPLYGITTDIIAGFSGETEDDFMLSLGTVKEAMFGKVHVFRYSPRKGTRGADMPDAVPGEIKIRRSEELEKLSSDVAEEFVRMNIGKRHRVLIEEINDGIAEGYTGNYIKVYIDDPAGELEPGSFCDAVLTELHADGCKAEAYL